MSTGKTVFGLLAGVAIGATLGILFAPDKGSVTRKNISKKGEDYMDNLRYRFYELMDRMNKKAEAVKEEGKDLVNKGKDIVDKGRAKYEDIKNEVHSNPSTL
jgi:gas vesicle protein